MGRTRSWEGTLVEQCAPTLAGVKAASLFHCQSPDLKEFGLWAAHWNTTLSAYGLRVRIVKVCRRTGDVLVYLYRVGRLEEILGRENVRAFLTDAGYPEGGNMETLLRRLSQRLCLERDFPHEIGVFLDYPLEDVVGFIENRGRNFTCSGCWKVYGDPEQARATFARYRKCTAAYRRHFENGTPITRLTVAA